MVILVTVTISHYALGKEEAAEVFFTIASELAWKCKDMDALYSAQVYCVSIGDKDVGLTLQ